MIYFFPLKVNNSIFQYKMQINKFFFRCIEYAIENSIQGIEFMEKFTNAINTITNLHVHIKCAMTKQSILCVCKLIELIKLMKTTMNVYSAEIFNTTSCLSQYQLYQALQIITNAKVTNDRINSNNE